MLFYNRNSAFYFILKANTADIQILRKMYLIIYDQWIQSKIRYEQLHAKYSFVRTPSYYNEKKIIDDFD